MPRFHCPEPLAAGLALTLPPGTARHVQVLRLQPGDGLSLFDGRGGEFAATVTRMGRSEVDVAIGPHQAVEREALRPVHLALGMPANDRMDWLVEKATELGVASIQPLMTAHSVLRMQGERAEKKRAHWQAVAVAACEQCGRNRVPTVHMPVELGSWLARLPQGAATADAGAPTDGQTGQHGNTPAAHEAAQHAEPGVLADIGLRLLLSLQPDAQTLQAAVFATPTGTPGRNAPAGAPLLFLSGPEGGLQAVEEAAAQAHGFRPVTLGPRILRAETAPLAALARLIS